MPTFNLFYLDDEKDDLIVPIIKRLETNSVLKIIWEKPKGFEADISTIEGKLASCSAILLDLQLDEKQIDGSQVKYQAPPLAQQIRTLATIGKIPDVPIILCSTAEKAKDSYKRDFTSHDLFDWSFMKSEVNEITIEKIQAIIEGYDKIENAKLDFSSMLERNSKELDDRVLSRFIYEQNPPVHEIARLIFKDLVQPTGILISEQILAARLGVDIAKSSDWSTIKDKIFGPAKYNGAFSRPWNRYWSDIVSDTFEAFSNDSLASLPGLERVEHLKKHTGLSNLIAAEPIKFCKSTFYWTICEVTKKPIDPFEGYKIDMKKEPKSWQDYKYVSLFALLERLAERESIRIHPSETTRYKLEAETLQQ